MMYIGIDGCRSGWIVAMIDDEKRLTHLLIPSLTHLPDVTATLALIDIPLEFPDVVYRPCEIAARALLGSIKSSSVFLTPHRSAVYATSYLEANGLNKSHLNKGLSKQSWNICNKIREAISFTTLRTDFPLFEAHPELCFYYLNQRVPLRSKKRRAEGAVERLNIIADHGEYYRQVIMNTMNVTKRKDVKLDDIIDATILAIRASASDLQTVPAFKPIGDRGAILY